MKSEFRIFSIITLSLLLSACGAKTTETVFPTQAAGMCGQGASENRLEDRFIVQWEDGSFTVENASSADEFRSSFVKKNLAYIKHVDHDYRVQLHTGASADSVSASDVATESDGSNVDMLSSLNWGPYSIQADSVWNDGVLGDGVLIGVVDGMVDVSHNQLADNIYVNTNEIPNNGIDDDGNGFIDDYRGIKANSGVNSPSLNRHGTHVAGIVAADPDFGPVSGVAPRAKIVPAQFIGNDGSGSIGDAIIALNYVANRGAKIINMSWGLGSCVQVPNLQATLKQLNDRGILLVTASGNGDSNGFGVNMDTSPAYPSAYNFTNQINVAASSRQNVLLSFSNYGMKNVHVAAPGGGIYSTTPNNQIETMSGTSMAAPMVSGAAALLWSAIPSATAAQIKQALISSVDLPPSPLKVYSGGVINVYRALSELKSLTSL